MREMPPWHFESADEMKVVLRVYGCFLPHTIIRRTLLHDAFVCSDQELLRDNRRAILFVCVNEGNIADRSVESARLTILVEVLLSEGVKG